LVARSEHPDNRRRGGLIRDNAAIISWRDLTAIAQEQVRWPGF